MTAPAAPPPLPAVWGRETVTLTPTVLETSCVAPTTVLLDHPRWTVVKKVRLTFINFKNTYGRESFWIFLILLWFIYPLLFQLEVECHQHYRLAILQTMTSPAAPPPLPAVWGRETVTLTPTVLGTWCVAQTTVQLAHPRWTVVNKVRKTFIDRILI